MYGTRVKKKEKETKENNWKGAIHPPENKKTITDVKELLLHGCRKMNDVSISCFGMAQDWSIWIQWHSNGGGALCLLPQKETTATKPAPAPRPTLVQ
jgi:hypothetical protein